MFEYQQIVDHIRATLGATGPQVAEQCRAALAEYSAAVEAVNGRLRKCESRLKQGLRSEALQLCDVEPNLLDSVSALDFPEREVWCQLLAQHGIVLPPQLLVDVAGQLNEAYAIEQPMAVLLRQHRLLALARSTLAQRLATLRALAEVDAGNAVWKTDLQLFEQQRHAELQGDVSAAVSQGSDSALAALEQELAANNWLTAPPETMLQQVQKSRAKISRHKARAELPALEEAFHQAQMNSDAAAGRGVRERWQAAARRAGLSPDDPCCQRVAGYLTWLASEEREEQAQAAHAAALADLELGLLNRVPAQNLEYLYSLAEASGREIRPELTERYNARLAALEKSATVRGRLTIAGLAASLLVLVGVGTLMLLHFRHREFVSGHTAALAKLIEAKETTEAGEYLERIIGESPSLVTESQIQELKGQLDYLKRKEAERETDFRHALGQAKEKGADLPDLEALARAKKLATRESELAAIHEFEEENAAQQRRRDQQRVTQFKQEVAELESRLTTWEGKPIAELAVVRGNISGLAGELKGLVDRSRSRVGGALIDSVTPLIARADALSSKLKQGELELVKLRTLSDSVGSIAEFHQALDDYVKGIPSGERAVAFRRVHSERVAWETIDQWNKISAETANQGLINLNPDSARLLYDRAQALLETSDFPGVNALRENLPYLSAIAKRHDVTGARLETRLKRAFEYGLVRDVWMVVQTDGQRLYCPADPKIVEGKLNSVTHFSDLNLSKAKSTVFAAKFKFSHQAPQAIVADAVSGLIAGIDDQNFEHHIYRIVVSLVTTPELKDLPAGLRDLDPIWREIDPVLKLDLLRKVLDVGCTGSYCLDKSFHEHLERLRDAKIPEDTNWVDPLNEDVKAKRAKALLVLGNFPNPAALKEAGKAVVADLARFRQSGTASYRWVGWLRRAENGAWQCEYKSPPAGSGKLFVAMLAGTGKQSRLEAIGMLGNDGAKIVPGTDAALVEGRPVYLELPPKAAP